MYVKSWLCFEAVFELMMLVRGAIAHSGSYPVISVWFYQKDTGRMDTFGGGREPRFATRQKFSC